MLGTRTWIVERGKGICSVAVSATLLGVPIFAVPGPGHGALGRAARHADPVAAGVAAPADPQPPQGGYIAQHSDGGYTSHHQDQGNGYGDGNGWGQGNGNGYGHDGRGDPPTGDQQTTPSPPAPPTPPSPPLVQQHQASTPSVSNSASGGQGNGDPTFPVPGPGDAHNQPPGNGSPGPLLRGGTGTGTCDGLCQHLGQTPSVPVPSIAVQATPTPVTVTPTTTSGTPPIVSTPSTPSVPSITTIPTIPTIPTVLGTTGLPSFSSSSSSGPVGFAGLGGAGGRGGVIPVLNRLITGAAALTLPHSLTGLAGTGGLGTLAPASAAAGFAPAATGLAVATTTGAHAGGHHAGGASHGGGTTIEFIPHFINHIPEGVWIALGASLLLAAIGAAAALISRRRAVAQAGELAAVSAAALTDPLTGVLNRRGFIEAVERELARARRYHHPFVLAYVDVRGLKTINDTEGHLAGDNLLQSVAALLTECARADDVVGRLGGDELGLLLVEQTPEAAKAVTRRIAAQVAARREAMGFAAPWDLTVGSAAFPQDGQSVDELLGTADRRLYQQRGIRLVSSR